MQKQQKSMPKIHAKKVKVPTDLTEPKKRKPTEQKYQENQSKDNTQTNPTNR